VLHRGHVTYLAQARALGGSLVVAINTDASARRLGKGPERPLNGEQDRAAMLAALEASAWSPGSTRTRRCNCSPNCGPQIYVKGGDYDMEAGRDPLVAGLGRPGAGHPVPDAWRLLDDTSLVRTSCAGPSDWRSCTTPGSGVSVANCASNPCG
jgi:cytidyltransferase-like protein